MNKIKAQSNGHSKNGRQKENGEFDLVDQASEIEQILQKAVQHELSIHKRLGNPVAVWKDGKTVIIPPEEIVLSSDS
jgi:hypothetical protein